MFPLARDDDQFARARPFPCLCEYCRLARGEHQSSRALPFAQLLRAAPYPSLARGGDQLSRALPFLRDRARRLPIITRAAGPSPSCDPRRRRSDSWAFDGPRLRVRSPLLRGDAPSKIRHRDRRCFPGFLGLARTREGSRGLARHLRSDHSRRLGWTLRGNLWVCLRLGKKWIFARATPEPARTPEEVEAREVPSGSDARGGSKELESELWF